MIRVFTTFCLLQLGTFAFAQLGGSSTYSYLNMPQSARIASLGGINISTYGDDINLGYQNPALLNAEMDGKFSASHALLKGNINHGYIVYGKYNEQLQSTMQFGLLYNSYGTMQLTDETGTQLGSFKAGEFVFQTGIGYSVSKLSYGGNIKLLYSQLESYSSFGAAIDLAAAYVDTAQRFSAGLVFKNIGTQFKSFTSTTREELPFQIQLGISKRLKYLPLRLSVTAHNLQQADIRYDDPSSVAAISIFSTDTFNQVDEKKYIGDKIFRHLIFAGEFYFGKNFNVRIAYDYLNQKEMAIDTKRGLTGFAMGAGIKVKKYQIDYAHEFYSIAGGSNHITIATDLDLFFK